MFLYLFKGFLLILSIIGLVLGLFRDLILLSGCGSLILLVCLVLLFLLTFLDFGFTFGQFWLHQFIFKLLLNRNLCLILYLVLLSGFLINLDFGKHLLSWSLIKIDLNCSGLNEPFSLNRLLNLSLTNLSCPHHHVSGYWLKIAAFWINCLIKQNLSY